MITNEKLLAWIRAVSEKYNEQKNYLTELDSAIGDADHGINMSRGFSAVLTDLEQKQPLTMGKTCEVVAMGLVKHVGGASGPLYGTFFLKMSKELAEKSEATIAEMYKAFQAGYVGLTERGKAHTGDKTMLDVWFPALETMKSCLEQGMSDDLQIMTKVVAVAEQKMKETIPMVAKKGRASYLGERSTGHQDPGATSSYYMLDATLKTW